MYTLSEFNRLNHPMISFCQRMVTQIPRYQNTGLVLLFGNVLHYGVKNIPPATLGLIAGQTAIFLGAEFLPDLQNACISSYLILYAKDWLRMVLSPFYHGSDMHLYYNMLSLLYKGSWLEKKFGTPYYLYLIGVFTALINTMYVLLGFVLTKIFNDDGYLKACAVGFSGVLFGMKVLTTHYAPRGPQLLLGFIPMPYEYMYWAELVLISLLVPNASFVGHLAGILIGCAYTWGPLQYVMDIFMQPAGSSVDPPSGTTSPRQQSLENLPGQPQQGPANPPPAGARPREPSLDIIAHGSTQRGYLAGHLAGILIGCAHTWGPLQYATDEVMQTAGNSVDPPSGTTSPRQQSPENLPDQEQQGPASPREPSLDIIAHGSTQQGYPYLAGLSRTIHGMHSRD